LGGTIALIGFIMWLLSLVVAYYAGRRAGICNPDEKLDTDQPSFDLGGGGSGGNTFPSNINFLTRNGVRLAYRSSGGCNGRQSQNVVLLHPDAFASVCWDPYLKSSLFSSYCLIAPDTRGCGYSDKTPPFSRQQDQDDVAFILDTLGVRGAVFVGWGGAVLVAQALYLARQDLVSKIVFVSGTASFIPNHALNFPFGSTTFAATANLIQTNRPGWENGILPFIFNDCPAPSSLTQKTFQMIDSCTTDKLVSDFSSLNDISFLNELSQFTLPILMIYGTKDLIVPDIGQMNEWLRERYPHAYIVSLEDKGWTAPWTAFHTFSQHLLDFLAGNPCDLISATDLTI